MSGDLDPGTIVDGRYEIESLIGSGGMADVYRAHDSELDRKVALKLLHRRFSTDPEFVERFRREASAAASMQHQNIVAIFDRGEWNSTYYIAMEYVSGPTLKQLIVEDAPLAPERAVKIAVQILKAAGFAHQKGIVHRDLKPQNVIIDEGDFVKVTDFGIARAGASDMTETGSILGTAQYLSPEQAQGLAVDGSTDLYSIGVVLYEMLTGKIPFDGDSAISIALKHVSDQPLTPREQVPTVPLELDHTVMCALAKDPAGRFDSAEEFIDALGGDVSVIEATTGRYKRIVRKRSVKKILLWGLLPLCLVATATTAVIYSLQPELKQVPDVVGQDLTTAAAVLQNEGFKVEDQRVVNEAEKDRVLRQDPQPGVKSKDGSVVTLVVSDGPGDATVPDLSGEKGSEAEQDLINLGFDVSVEEQSSGNVKQGRVVKTEPPAGSQIEKGSAVTLVVSLGRKRVKVPNLVGKDKETVRSDLDALGLLVDVTEAESSEDPGTVLRQMPAPGEKVKTGSTVKVVVAVEVTQVTIPSVVGESQESAASELSSLGLTVVFKNREVRDPDNDGRVVAQSPGRGSRVKKGATITIVIGKLRQQTTSTTPPVTTTTETAP